MKKGSWKDRTWVGFSVILLCYLAAAWLGSMVFLHTEGYLWFRLLAADSIATLFIWVISMIFRNASVYDPYWSVQPIVILTLLLIQSGRFDIGSLLIYSIILFWGFRLTSNWAYTFKGLGRQDWRYDQIKNRTGRMYQIVNLVGIQLMPTFIVYLCILPAVYYIVQPSSFHPASLLGLAVSAAAAVLQMVSDIQLHRFRSCAADRSQIIRTGLWKYSRHPNYLGEILMWWGIYLAMLPAHPNLWFLLVGAALNTLLFLFISIPLAEKHLAGYKENYEEYRKETRMLLPVPRVEHLPWKSNEQSNISN